MSIEIAESITHQHLLSILNTESASIISKHPLRLLDVGCGDGHLINYLMKNYGVFNSAMKIDIYGFDVNDYGVQSKGYFSTTIEFLLEHFPDISWENRLHVFSTSERWPYPDDFFDIIISNQVVEHVRDHNLFFHEINRTLCRDGYSVHLFPLKHYFYEGHLHLPLVHKILNHEFMVSYIKLFSRFGIGKYWKQHRESSVSLDEYSERHADYICFFTNYISYRDVLRLGKKYSLRTSFRYTQQFYISKLRSILGLKPLGMYERNRLSLVDWFSVHLFKYISSVTLVLHKTESYMEK